MYGDCKRKRKWREKEGGEKDMIEREDAVSLLSISYYFFTFPTWEWEGASLFGGGKGQVTEQRGN